jgi:hypothetical protein
LRIRSSGVSLRFSRISVRSTSALYLSMIAWNAGWSGLEVPVMKLSLLPAGEPIKTAPRDEHGPILASDSPACLP